MPPHEPGRRRGVPPRHGRTTPSTSTSPRTRGEWWTRPTTSPTRTRRSASWRRRCSRAEALAYIREHHGRHHEGQDHAHRVLQPRAHRRPGGHPRAHDLQLRLRPAQREHPLSKRVRRSSTRRRRARGCSSRTCTAREPTGRRTFPGRASSWTGAGSRPSACTAPTPATP